MNSKSFIFFELMAALFMILVIFTTILLIFKKKEYAIAGIHPIWMVGLFALKIAGATLLWQYYNTDQHRELVDIFKFYDNGITLYQQTKASPYSYTHLMLFKEHTDELSKKIALDCGNWDSSSATFGFQGNRLMIRCNALLAIFSGRYYFTHLWIFTFLGFTGFVLGVKSLSSLHLSSKKILLILLTLSPTLLFWTSGILKETIVVFFLGWLLYLLSINKRNRIFTFSGIILATYMIWVIKPFIGMALIPSMTFLLLQATLRLSVKKSAFFTVGLLLIMATITHKQSSVHPIRILNHKLEEFNQLAETYDAQSTYATPVIEQTTDLLSAVPISIVNTLFRPSVLEVRKKTYIPFAIENLILLVLVIFVLISTKDNNQDEPFQLFAIFFVLSSCTIIGLSIPIFGASIRYRAPALFILYMLLLLLLDKNYQNAILNKKPS